MMAEMPANAQTQPYNQLFAGKKSNRKNKVGKFQKYFTFATSIAGELAQLARALAWHARGHRFDSGILHKG